MKTLDKAVDVVKFVAEEQRLRSPTKGILPLALIIVASTLAISDCLMSDVEETWGHTATAIDDLHGKTNETVRQLFELRDAVLRARENLGFDKPDGGFIQEENDGYDPSDPPDPPGVLDDENVPT